MNYNNLKNNWPKLCLLTMMLAQLLFVSGCVSLEPRSGILTSKEQMWTIPAGTKFTAIQAPKYSTPKEFAADEDLAVLYKGKLLELEVEADSRAFKAADQARTRGLWLGILGSLLALIAGLVIKAIFSKVFAVK